MAKKRKSKVKSSTTENVWSLNQDKKYFIELWRFIQEDREKSLITFFAVVSLLTLTLLYVETKVISTSVWGISFIVIVLVATILLNPGKVLAGLRRDMRENRKEISFYIIGLACLVTSTFLHFVFKVIDIKVWDYSAVVVMVFMMVITIVFRKRGDVVPHNFDPVSSGTLWFSFAVTLLINQQTKGWNLYNIILEVFFTLGAMVFLVAVFSRKTRKYLNTKAVPEMMLLTLIAFVFGFALGWVPILNQVSIKIREVIVYFGFLWIVAMIMVMLRDGKNELVRILFVAYFVAAAFIKFFENGAIGIISGIALFVIAVLLYLVATDRLHPYGELS